MFLVGKSEKCERKVWVSVGPADMVRPGRPLIVETQGLRILLCNTSAGLTAVESICSHQALPLDRARVIGEQLICPHHGARFDLSNGCPLGGAALRPLRTFPVVQVDSEIRLHLPSLDGTEDAD